MSGWLCRSCVSSLQTSCAMCFVCFVGGGGEGALVVHSAGGQRVSPRLARRPAGETPLAARRADPEGPADTLAEGETRQRRAFCRRFGVELPAAAAAAAFLRRKKKPSWVD